MAAQVALANPEVQLALGRAAEIFQRPTRVAASQRDRAAGSQPRREATKVALAALVSLAPISRRLLAEDPDEVAEGSSIRV